MSHDIIVKQHGDQIDCLLLAHATDAGANRLLSSGVVSAAYAPPNC
jgi:hypothetical protein